MVFADKVRQVCLDMEWGWICPDGSKTFYIEGFATVVLSEGAAQVKHFDGRLDVAAAEELQGVLVNASQRHVEHLRGCF